MKKITTLSFVLALALTMVSSASAGDDMSMKAKCDKMMKMDQAKMTDKEMAMMKKCKM